MNYELLLQLIVENLKILIGETQWEMLRFVTKKNKIIAIKWIRDLTKTQVNANKTVTTGQGTYYFKATMEIFGLEASNFSNIKTFEDFLENPIHLKLAKDIVEEYLCEKTRFIDNVEFINEVRRIANSAIEGKINYSDAVVEIKTLAENN